MKLLGLGDNVMDAYLFRGELYPGGNAANVAVLAKRAGAEKSGYIGVLATDAALRTFSPTVPLWSPYGATHLRSTQANCSMVPVKQLTKKRQWLHSWGSGRGAVWRNGR